jgi:hypothetical protein
MRVVIPYQAIQSEISVRKRRPSIPMLIGCVLLLSLLFGCGGPDRAPALDPTGGPSAPTARQALPVAEAAASAWMRDARLIYLENDGALRGEGGADTWGFLFRSEIADSWRNIAVSGGTVVHEGPLPFPFAAPVLPESWIDSARAVQIAETSGGRAFREQRGAALRHAVLGRGVFTDWGGPATWTVIYRAADHAELAIVVNADDGSVLERFEG